MAGYTSVQLPPKSVQLPFRNDYSGSHWRISFSAGPESGSRVGRLVRALPVLTINLDWTAVSVSKMPSITFPFRQTVPPARRSAGC